MLAKKLARDCGAGECEVNAANAANETSWHQQRKGQQRTRVLAERTFPYFRLFYCSLRTSSARQSSRRRRPFARFVDQHNGRPSRGNSPNRRRRAQRRYTRRNPEKEETASWRGGRTGLVRGCFPPAPWTNAKIRRAPAARFGLKIFYTQGEF